MHVLAANMQERDGDAKEADGASDRGEVFVRRPRSQLVFVLQALGLTAFLMSPISPGYWWYLAARDHRLTQSILVLGWLALFLGLLAFRWRWARPAAALCAVSAIACFFL